MSYYRLEDVTDLSDATIIGSADEYKSETFLKFKGNPKLYEIITDLSGEYVTYPDTSYVRIDGIPFSLNDAKVGHVEKTTADIFDY